MRIQTALCQLRSVRLVSSRLRIAACLFVCEVQQRGIAATQALIEALLDGVELDDRLRPVTGANVVIVDLMPARLVHFL